MPTPSVNALKVTMLSVIPIRPMTIREDRTETGIELPTINDAFRSPKNSQMMIIEITIAMTSVSATESRDSLMLSALSFTIVIFKSESWRCKDSIVLLT